MTDYKTLRVPEDAWEEAKAQKEKENRTWGEQLVCSNDSTTSESSVEGTVVDREALAEDRQEQLEEVVYSACGDTATEESIKELAGRIDDLETTLPAKVAEELQR